MISSPLRLGSRPWQGYVIAVIGVLVCTVARALLEPFLGSQAFLLPYVLAVLPSAWIGGVGAGLAATALSVVAAIGVLGAAPATPPGWMDTDTHIALFAFEATLIVALTVAVRRSRDTAAAHNAAKDGLLAAVSHDLRTPLSVITGWATHLQRQPDDPAIVERAAAAIQRAVQTQQRLIEDLLDVSRAANNKLTIAHEPVDLNRLLEDVVEGVRAAADRKRVALDVHVAAPIGPLAGDPARLQQVFGNLLDNAVKFTPPHGRVSLVVDESGGSVRVEVADTGAGIPKDEIAKVFEPFHQIPQRHGTGGGGLGLGLAIARQLIDLHGGTIRVESPGVNRGSRFVVTLPADSGQHEFL
jgi:signal transduction histidine kinase